MPRCCFSATMPGRQKWRESLNIRHIPIGKRVPEDPKPLRVLFDEAQRPKRDVLCYANCDIVLARDLLHAINVVEMIRNEFLMVGRRWNIEQNEPISMVNQVWDQEFRMRARTQGKSESVGSRVGGGYGRGHCDSSKPRLRIPSCGSSGSVDGRTLPEKLPAGWRAVAFVHQR